MDYKPQALDKKWQERWTSARAFEVTEDPSRPKFYCLEMFAYPSGHAHVGHVRNYIIGDVMARTKRLRGYNVLHPFGWDAFGMPAENAAIKSGIHPETSTLANIAHMKGQLQRLGISYAWSREFATCEPTYYKWNQWLFIKMYERGLAYRRRSSVNWCPSCQTVLANEQVVDGGCWRCGTPVTTRDLEQWFFKITHYADDLLKGIDQLGQWPEKVLTMQKNWIGRSEGTRVTFPVLAGEGAAVSDSIEVFTTRIDTIFGATCVFLAPEHEMVDKFAILSDDADVFRKRVTGFRTQDRTARLSGDIEKEGFFTGRYALNPFTQQRIPIWIANFVLGEYGTGAVMAVPAHDQRDFEFATKYDLPIKVVIHPDPDLGHTPEEARGRLRRLWPSCGIRRVHGSDVGGGISADGGVGRAAGHRNANGSIPFEGLGNLAPAVLGHADSDDLLRQMRHCARALRPVAGRAAESDDFHGQGRLAAGAGAGVRERGVSDVRGKGQARN